MITLEIDDELVPEDHRISGARARAIEAAVGVRFPERQGTIGVSFVVDEEIRRLNRMYRHKDRVTDVLSFASDFGDETGMLGDVIISYDQAVRQAQDGDIELELADLLVHGILHIFGYDHEDPGDAAVMFPLQDGLIQQIL